MDPISTAAAAASGGGGIFSSLASIGSSAAGIGSLLSGLGSLFGGKKKKDDGPSAEELIAMQLRHQFDWSAKAAIEMPAFQVQGLRKAGLNPMLAVGKGISGPDYAKASMPMDDRSISLQRSQLDLQKASAMSALALQASQVELTRAQTAKTIAETETETKRPENIAGDTALKNAQQNAQQALSGLHTQQNVTSAAQQAVLEVEKSLKDFDLKNLQPQQLVKLKQDIEIMAQELKTAVRIGKLDESKFGEVMGYIKRLTESIGLSTGVSRRLGK